jgi:hypothetical protein
MVTKREEAFRLELLRIMARNGNKTAIAMMEITQEPLNEGNTGDTLPVIQDTEADRKDQRS